MRVAFRAACGRSRSRRAPDIRECQRTSAARVSTSDRIRQVVTWRIGEMRSTPIVTFSRTSRARTGTVTEPPGDVSVMLPAAVADAGVNAEITPHVPTPIGTTVNRVNPGAST